MGEHVGYIRVSTAGQNTERQLDGVTLDQTYEEKISAKNTKRPILQECLKYVRKGDTLHVHSIDRLARNLEDLQSIVKQLNGKGVIVHFHKENLIFTGKNDHTQTLLFQMLGAVAQFERALIKERQAEGIAAAKARGKHLGRPSKVNDKKKAEIISKRKEGATPTQLAKEYDISRTLVYLICGDIKRQQPC